MDRSLKWRTLILFGIILACVGILLPNLVAKDDLPGGEYYPFKNTKLAMGLDLQGGTHIVYSIDLDKAVDDRASEIKRDLEARFADDTALKQKPVVRTPRAPLGAVSVTFPEAAKRAEVIAGINQDYKDTIEERPCE